MSMKTKLIMGVVTIATFAISLNLYSSDEKMGVNAPRTQVLRGGNVYCAFNDYVGDCMWTYNGATCIEFPGVCGQGIPVEPDPNAPTLPPGHN